MSRKQPHHAAPAHFLHQYPGIALELCSSDRRVDLLREDFICVVRTEHLHARGPRRASGKLRRVKTAPAHNTGALLGIQKTLTTSRASHAVVHYSLTPGVSSPGFAFRNSPRYAVGKTGGMLTVNSTEAARPVG